LRREEKYGFYLNEWKNRWSCATVDCIQKPAETGFRNE